MMVLNFQYKAAGGEIVECRSTGDKEHPGQFLVVDITDEGNFWWVNESALCIVDGEVIDELSLVSCARDTCKVCGEDVHWCHRFGDCEKPTF